MRLLGVRLRSGGPGWYQHPCSPNNLNIIAQLAQVNLIALVAHNPYMYQMTDKPKDQRIPVMMSADEVEAIDDWSFKNRIRSRSEAIRQLIQVGLKADKPEKSR